MKIAQIIPSLECGGAEREVVRLTASLKDAGHDCEIVCLSEEGPIAADARALGVEVRVLGCGRNLGLHPIRQLTKYLQKSRPQVAHSHLSSWAPIAAKLAGVPVIIRTEHGLSLYKKWPQRLFDKLIMTCFADKMVVVAGAIKEVRNKRFGIPEGKLAVIPNGIDLRRFDLQVDPSAVRAELGLSTDKRLVLTVGRLMEVKGYNYLLDAAALLLKSNAPVEFAFVGDGPIMEELKSQARELGISDSARFLGFRSDIERILRSADVFVLSSLREGTSIAILEAMAAGTPVVATAVGGTPEIIQDGVNGLLVPSKDPPALADAIARVVSDPDLAASLRDRGLERVQTEYSAAAVLEKVQALYREELGAER